MYGSDEYKRMFDDKIITFVKSDVPPLSRLLILSFPNLTLKRGVVSFREGIDLGTSDSGFSLTRFRFS